jgi:hypothetical protein
VAAEGGRVGVSIYSRGVNRLQYAGQILIYIAVPEPEHEETTCC